jgi:L-fucose mutarotase
MLKGLDPLLTPDLLRTLRAMGHGDEIAIVDGNYPAESAGPPVIRLDGISTTAALNAVLSVMPLDSFVPAAAWCMEVVGQPDAEQPIFGEFRGALRKYEGERFQLAKLERFAFYERAGLCFSVVATGERRLYGNIILKKGVIGSAE